MEQEPHPGQAGGACTPCLRRAAGPRPFDEGPAQLEHVRIRGKDTTPEKRVRTLLHRLGYRFRLHVRVALSASPGERVRVRCRIPRSVSVDIILPKYKTAIFVHGCFWHRHRRCKNCTTPTHRRAWWLKKLEGNAVRDKLHQRALRKLGWRTIVVWE